LSNADKGAVGLIPALELASLTDQVEGQKKKRLAPVIIKGEEEYEIKKILNKRRFRGKD